MNYSNSEIFLSYFCFQVITPSNWVCFVPVNLCIFSVFLALIVAQMSHVSITNFAIFVCNYALNNVPWHIWPTLTAVDSASLALAVLWSLLELPLKWAVSAFICLLSRLFSLSSSQTAVRAFLCSALEPTRPFSVYTCWVRGEKRSTWARSLLMHPFDFLIRIFRVLP